jgi:hypothetical protein
VTSTTITGVPNGNYTLELEVNPVGVIQESSYADNLATIPITIGTPNAPPANDTFANAQLLVGGSPSVTGPSLNATKETGEPNHAGNSGGHSVWYQWTAPNTKPVTIDTVGSSFNTLLAVYTGSSVGNLTLVASNDDLGAPTNLQSRVAFNATAGTLYRIAVDGYNGAAGDIVLTLDQSVANDNFTSVVFIGGSFGTVHGINAGATKEAGEPNHAGNLGGASIWYAWTSPNNGTVTFDTIGSTFNTLLGIYTGAGLASLVPVASNDDIGSPTNLQSAATFPVTGLTRYWIAVDGYNGDSGNVTLNWNEIGSAVVGTGVAGLPTLTCGLTAQGDFELTVARQPSQGCTIEVSGDLVNWSELKTVAFLDGTARLNIRMAGERQFFRAKLLP